MELLILFGMDSKNPEAPGLPIQPIDMNGGQAQLPPICPLCGHKTRKVVGRTGRPPMFPWDTVEVGKFFEIPRGDRKLTTPTQLVSRRNHAEQVKMVRSGTGTGPVYAAKVYHCELISAEEGWRVWRIK